MPNDKAGSSNGSTEVTAGPGGAESRQAAVEGDRTGKHRAGLPHKARGLWATLAAVVATVAAVAGLALTLIELRDRLAPGGKRTEVPQVVGQEVEVARQLLDEVGLGVRSVTHRFHDERVGVVVSQRPKPGEEVDEGDKLELVVSEGIEVPSLLGRRLEDAVELIRKAGIEAQTTGRYARQPMGMVIGQEPPDGRGVDPGTLVALYVSKGVRVPNVVGLPVQEAVSATEAAGLSIGPQTRRFSRRPRDEVISQGALPGKAVEPDTPVALLISRGMCPLRARIVTPAPGEAVPDAFEASGTVCAQRLGRRRLWVVVEVFGVGGYFPKAEIQPAGGRWSVPVVEGGSDRSSSLVVLVVGRADHRRIGAWFDDAVDAASFPALRLPSAKRLASVELVRR